MIRQLLMAVIVLFAFGTLAQAAKVEGVDVPETMTLGNTKLVLNGAGARKKKLGPISKNVYVAGLYLKDKDRNSKRIIDADETMVLRIKIVTSLITSKKFTDHARDGFKESTGGNTAPIQKEIEAFLSAFADEIRDDDLFEIAYKKGVGIQVFKNGSRESKITVPGMAIKSALFGIWLGERSEDNLKTLARQLVQGA